MTQASSHGASVVPGGFADWSIRTKIAVVVGVPCLVAVLGMALVLPEAVESYERAMALRASNQATDLLIVAASEQAKERGFTTSLLSSAASRELAPRVLPLRASGDGPLDAALAATAHTATDNALLQRARRELLELRHLRDALRLEVDAAIGRYPPPTGLITRWFDAQTALIESEDRYMRALFVAQNPYELIVQYNTYIKRYVFLASEFAGRERATLSAVIASRQPIAPATQANLDKWRGVVEENLDAIRQLKSNPDMPQSLVNSIAVMEQRFLGPFDAVRASVYAASRDARARAADAPVEAVNYPLSPPAWIEQSTLAIDSVIAVSASISRSAEAISAQQTRESLVNLALLMLMFAALIAAVWVSVLVSRATTRPLLRLRDAAQRFGADDAAGVPQTQEAGAMEQAVGAITARDEIGQVARSLADMAHRMREAMALLATEKQAVESRVRERTAQLSEQQAHAEDLAVTLAAQNDKLGTANQYLIELNAERNEFLNLCTHELKSPLVSQVALMDLLKDEADAAERARLFARLEASTGRMLTLVQNLLRVSALEVGAQRFASEAVDLPGAVREAVAQNAERARRKHISLDLDLDGIDPSAARVVGDRTATVQIADNLLSNAIKFSRPGRAVHISLVLAASSVRLHVRDQGPGIAEAEQALLFRKFSKLSPRPTDGEPSSGLGLAIVRQLAAGMGAQVACSSQLGEGSDFHVSFRAIALNVALAPVPKPLRAADSTDASVAA